MIFCLLALFTLTAMSAAQCPSTNSNVTTWHNDLNRTGWQCNESTLTAQPSQPGSVNQSNFGLLYQWAVTGRPYAQPLAVSLNQTVGSCTTPP